MTNMSTCRLSFVVGMPVFLLLWATLRYRSHQPATTHTGLGVFYESLMRAHKCVYASFLKCVGLLKILIFVFDQAIVL